MIVAQRLAGVVVVLALLALIVISSAWNLRVPPSALGIEGTLASDPAHVFRQLRPALLEGGKDVSAPYRQAVFLNAQRDPLSDEPFILAAITDNIAGRYRQSLTRLELARERDPRNRITRIMLFEAYLREARAKDVVTEAAVLDRLRAGSTPTFLPLLANLAQNPTTRDATAKALGSSPLDFSILNALAQRQVSASLLTAFADRARLQPPFNVQAKQQINALLSPYLKADNWTEAAQIWIHFYKRPLGELGKVTDPQFAGTLGPPFGWELTRSDGGLVAFGEQGLELVDYGRKGWVVARQALILEPGTYELSTTLEATSQVPPQLNWWVDCADSAAILLNLPLMQARFLGVAPQATFTVPVQDCPVQWLALAARPGDTAQTTATTLRSVGLARRRAE